MPKSNSESRREWRGYGIIAGLVIAIALIVNFPRVVDVFSERYDVVVLLPQAGGVRPGTPVEVAGIEAGMVTTVEMLTVRRPLPGGDTAGVAVHVRLEETTRAVIRSDSPVQAGARRVIGEEIIRIDPGSAGGARVSDGDTLLAVPASSARDVMAAAATLPATLDSLMSSGREIAALVESRRSDLTRLELRIAAALDEAGTLSAGLEHGTLGRLLSDPAVPARIDALRATVGGLSAAIDTAVTRYTGDETDASLGPALDRLSRRSEVLRADLALLQQRIDEGEGMLGRMRRDSALAVAITGVRAQVDTLRAEAMSIVKRMFLPGGL